MSGAGAGAGGELRVDLAVVGLGLIGSAALREAAAVGAASGAVVAGIGPAEPAVLSEHAGPFASHYDSGRITRHLDARFEWALLAQRAIARYGAARVAEITVARTVGSAASLKPRSNAVSATFVQSIAPCWRVEATSTSSCQP